MFASAERVELAAAWEGLVAGTTKVESWSHANERWSMRLSHYSEPARAPLPPEAPTSLRVRDVEILEHTLLCGARKQVAVEVGLSCSSVAIIMQNCFQFMGLTCLPSRIPGLVVAAAHASHHERSRSRPRGGRVVAPGLIAVPRPDRALGAWLAPAEHTVVSMLIEGMSYAEIAHARHTSVRTVANQIASAFRRLGVSGRAELLCMLARWGFEPPEPPPKRPSAPLPSAAKRALSRGLQLLEEASSSTHCLSPSPAS